eukprot:762048-Hanusia_phi.AAC.5
MFYIRSKCALIPTYHPHPLTNTPRPDKQRSAAQQLVGRVSPVAREPGTDDEADVSRRARRGRERGGHEGRRGPQMRQEETT